MQGEIENRGFLRPDPHRTLLGVIVIIVIWYSTSLIFKRGKNRDLLEPLTPEMADEGREVSRNRSPHLDLVQLFYDYHHLDLPQISKY